MGPKTGRVQLFQSAAGVRIAHREMGTGRSIVVLPAGPASWGPVYRRSLKPLAASYRLVFWDYRGCGNSSPASQYSIAEDLSDFRELMEHLHLRNPVLMGHGYGGMLALRYVLNHPHLASGLVLISTPPSAEAFRDAGRRAREKMEPAEFDEWADLRSRMIRGELSEAESTRYRELDAFHKLYDRTKARDLIDGYFTRMGIVLRMQREFSEFNLKEEVGRIDCPTLVLYGLHDRVVGSAPQYLHYHIRDSFQQIFRKSGHFPFLEERDRFVEQVSGWLHSFLPPWKGGEPPLPGRTAGKIGPIP